MRELIIIAEGGTEEDFAINSIRPYFNQHGIHSVTPIQVTMGSGSRGGLLKGSYRKLKKDALRYLRADDVIVTTLIDYYHLPSDFPEYELAMSKVSLMDKINHLEDAIKRDIDNYRFIPYIQLHEFEALLFTKIDGFKGLPDVSAAQLTTLENILNEFENPELINNGVETAPSKRLLNIIPGYQKKLYGSYIPLVNGFDSILALDSIIGLKPS
ncbi:MAG TPA: DUF4276 family protein [Ferruginibacter sp.]|jgi:hypothetical protein|nr:DUF4276 family protein [Ferruginibacter sp.]